MTNINKARILGVAGTVAAFSTFAAAKCLAAYDTVLETAVGTGMTSATENGQGVMGDVLPVFVLLVIGFGAITYIGRKIRGAMR